MSSAMRELIARILSAPIQDLDAPPAPRSPLGSESLRALIGRTISAPGGAVRPAPVAHRPAPFTPGLEAVVLDPLPGRRGDAPEPPLTMR